MYLKGMISVSFRKKTQSSDCNSKLPNVLFAYVENI